MVNQVVKVSDLGQGNLKGVEFCGKIHLTNNGLKYKDVGREKCVQPDMHVIRDLSVANHDSVKDRLNVASLNHS